MSQQQSVSILMLQDPGHEKASMRRVRIVLFSMIVMIGILTLLQKFCFPFLSYGFLFIVFGTGFVFMQTIAGLHKKRKPSQSLYLQPVLDLPKISIIVPAYNESTVIENTVLSLLKLTYPNLEIWIVNDRSTDGTGEIIERLKSKYPDRLFSYHRSPALKSGKAAVLNEIDAMLSGEILAVFDADAQVQPDFLDKLLYYFESSDIAAVQARKALLNPNQNWLTKCQQYEYALDACIQLRRDSVQGAVELRGNGMLIRRNALAAVGGWNEQSITEDLDLSTRFHLAGYDIRYASGIAVFEEALPSFIPLFWQRIRWTEGSVVRYLENLKALMKNPDLSFRVKCDAGQFLFEFVAPLWLLLENLMMLFRWPHMFGQVPNMLSPAVLGVLTLYFCWHLFRGAKLFINPSILKSMKGTIVGYLYLSLVWLPLVFTLLPRILFSTRRNTQWIKTPHYGVMLNDAA